MTLRVGITGHPRDLPAVLAAGADFLEPTIVGGLLARDGRPSVEVPEGVRFPGFCVLFPGGLSFARPGVDLAPVRDHLEQVFARLVEVAEPGAHVVLGSGAARTIPDDVSRQDGLDALAAVVDLTWTMGRDAGLRVLLEPLNTGETNAINHLVEAVGFLDDHGLHHVDVVCDWYHLLLGGEGLEDVLPHLDRIGHVHVADTGRVPPGLGDWPLDDLLDGMVAAGYDGAVSIECRWDDMAAQAPAAIDRVRRAVERPA